MRVVVKPLNCTVPYFKDMLSYVDDVPTWEPLLLVNDYARITSSMLENYNRLPACERVENQMQMTTSRDYTRSPDYSFRVETSFSDLQYEKYSEIRLTTSAGFISELGGQSGLDELRAVDPFNSESFCYLFPVEVYVRYFSLALSINLNAAENTVGSTSVQEKS
ncbi:hypothetical protein OSTOST_25595, partial [Ostertagia ostertagi]